MASESHWRALDLPAGVTVDGIEDISPGVVSLSGLRDGRGYAVKATSDGQFTEIAIPPEAAAQGSARVVRISDFGVLGVCGATALWGRTWHPYASTASAGSVHRDGDGALEVLAVPSNEIGAPPAWVWVTAGDENLQATAAYATIGGHEIRPLETDTHQLMPIEQPLVTTSSLSDVHIAAFAGRVTAAGPINDPDEMTTWWARSYIPGPGDRPDPLPWRHNAFEEPPRLITDGADSGGMSFYAGIRRNGTAALWDATGDLRESTDLVADTADRVVLIGGIEAWGSYGEGDEPGGLAAFAVKTPLGNILSFEGKTLGMPAGGIRSVILNLGFDCARCFALIDGVVYVAEIEYEMP